MSYFIDDIINSPYTKVRLSFLMESGATDTVEGFLIDDTISFDASASYNDFSDLSVSSAIDGLGEVASKLPGMLGKAGQLTGKYGSKLAELGAVGAKAAGYASQLIQQTILGWEGSEKPVFDIGLLFILTEESGKSPAKIAASLNSKCFPLFGSSIGNAGANLPLVSTFLEGAKSTMGYFFGSQSSGEADFLMRAPMGYKPYNVAMSYTTGQTNPLTGTCSLQIGQWFNAPVLVLQNSSFEISKECAPNGVPLYAQGKVQLTTPRMISDEEYRSFFIDKGALASILP